MPTSALAHLLQRLDGASYKAYHDLKGAHQFPSFTLIFDRIQADPFAAPTQCRVVVDQSIAQFPSELFSSQSREIALCDFLTREFAQAVQASANDRSGKRGSGKSGQISIIPAGQAILERSAVWIDARDVEVRFRVGLPAYGRRIAGREAIELLCDELPSLIDRVFNYKSLQTASIQKRIREHLEAFEDAEDLRSQLEDRNLVAFVANQSILPRRSGIDDRPLKPNSRTSEAPVIPFRSPSSLEVTLETRHCGLITGMGIPKGVTLIVGGGFHGKSTLLHSLERGIYNHIPGDGREGIVTVPTAVRIRAEEGRSIQDLDISPFINHLPFERSTTQFSTENASGSTSQAANILEAIQSGTTLLLLDEDTCATNFMIRDRRMQQLIHKDKEPITPFLDRIRQLYEEAGISTILVMGGCGDYLDVADTVIAMDSFQAQDVTQQARDIAQIYKNHRQIEAPAEWHYPHQRQLQAGFLDRIDRSDRRKVRVDGVTELAIGDCCIDLSQVEQLEESGQLRSIAATLMKLNDEVQSTEILQPILESWDRRSLDDLTPYPQGDLVRVRPIEIAAAIDRMRSRSS